ncbi:MAG: halocyanin, partial [Haloferacaceae archaeon]
MSENDVSRRAFLRTAAGASAAAGAAATGAGTASAQEGAEPDFEGYLDGIDGGYEDLRGEDEVTVDVG